MEEIIPCALYIDYFLVFLILIRIYGAILHRFPIMLEILPILISLIVVEVLLSIDNALVNAALADQFATKERKHLIRLGIVLEIVFRIVTLVLMAVIVKNIWLKFICGLYLMAISIKHIGRPIDRDGHIVHKHDTPKFALFQIAIVNRVFSINNIFAIASFTTKLALVIPAVVVSMISVAFAAPYLAKLIKRYRGLSEATFTILGMLGFIMCCEAFFSIYLSNTLKTGIVLGVLLFTVIFEHSHQVRMFATPLLRAFQYVIALPLDFLYLFTKKKS